MRISLGHRSTTRCEHSTYVRLLNWAGYVTAPIRKIMVLKKIRQNVQIVPIMPGIRWKLMICIRLEQFL